MLKESSFRGCHAVKWALVGNINEMTNIVAFGVDICMC